jgi:ATP-dependent Clp protease ATP-binding subunit ClpC
LFERFTERARRVVVLAQEEARSLRHDYIGTEHLLLGVLREGSGVAAQALVAMTLDEARVRALVIETVGLGSSDSESAVPFTPRAKKALEMALRESLQLGHAHIGTEHLLLGLIRDPEGLVTSLLTKLEINIAALRERVVAEVRGTVRDEPGEDSDDTEDGGRLMDRNRAKKGSLDQYATNLTEQAANGVLDPVVGRTKEIERVIRTLARRSKNNPVLVGEPGVGKTAIVEGLAQRIVAGMVPEALKGKEVYALDLASMVAGARYRGDFEERLKKTVAEIRSRGNIIVFIDEIHTLIGAGGSEGAMDAANILKPMLSRGQMQVIGATTSTEYRKYIERDAALERRLQQVKVDAPGVEETVRILAGLRDRYEAHHQISISDEAILAAATLADRYVPDRFLPDKAIDLMDEASARLHLAQSLENLITAPLSEQAQQIREAKEKAIEAEDFALAAELRAEELALLAPPAATDPVDPELVAPAKGKKGKATAAPVAATFPVLTAEMIAEVLSDATGVPVAQVSVEEGQRLMTLEGKLKERVIGQDDAVAALARAVRRARAGLKDPNRPAGSFIFAGPTGVGKTELAKTLASHLFGTEDALITVDMSEYSEKHTVARLFGSPPGYVGFEDGGQLTEKVRRRPFSVILLDEVEKAHPDIFNSMLQVLDEGRLTDSQGRAIDFRNTVIIMTTNLGSKEINRGVPVGFATAGDTVGDYERMRSKVDSELKTQFRPEFLNRIDETVVFRPLDRDAIAEIVHLLVARLAQRLQGKGIGLRVTPAAALALAERGYDPALGARPLRRVIQRQVEDELSEKLLMGEYAAGDTIVLDAVGDEDRAVLVFAGETTLDPSAALA